MVSFDNITNALDISTSIVRTFPFLTKVLVALSFTSSGFSVMRFHVVQ